MRKTLISGEYTQINTNDTEFLIQNVSTYDVLIVVADSQPATNKEYDFILQYGNGISDSMVTGLCWGKPNGKVNITVGIVEG